MGSGSVPREYRRKKRVEAARVPSRPEASLSGAACATHAYYTRRKKDAYRFVGAQAYPHPHHALPPPPEAECQLILTALALPPRRAAGVLPFAIDEAGQAMILLGSELCTGRAGTQVITWRVRRA